MKVGTDSLILGSWSQADCLLKDNVEQQAHSSRIQIGKLAVKKILDVGTGTGLLSLMLAQKTQSEQTRVYIDAVEIDADACEQAAINFSRCKWHNRLNLIRQDFFELTDIKKYDWIIANPPYFSSDNCMDEQRQLARQTRGISWQSWLNQISIMLKPSAICELVVPHSVASLLTGLAADYSLKLKSRLDIKPSPQRAVKLCCLRFQKVDTIGFSLNLDEVQIETLQIYDTDNAYTPAYKTLCKAYYLKF